MVAKLSHEVVWCKRGIRMLYKPFVLNVDSVIVVKVNRAVVCGTWAEVFKRHDPRRRIVIS